MKKYTIITTYPEHISKNIGDWLITKSTISCLKSLHKEEVHFNIVWRQANWDDIKYSIQDSYAIVFASFTISGKNIFAGYPFLKKIIELNKPVGIISAGSQLTIYEYNVKSLFRNLTKESAEVLKKLNDKCIFITTRGYLTQELFERNDLSKSVFTGDIAFFDNRFDNRIFEIRHRITKIAISDPHKPHAFKKSLTKLVLNLKDLFPYAEINILIHSKNYEIEKLCQRVNLSCKKLYEDKENGLDSYDEYDLHIGYRIHGHVSALIRRIPSYLIEQDGRGCDYGLTFDKKITVSGFPEKRIRINISNVLRFMLNKKLIYSEVDNLISIDKLIAIIRQDRITGFSKFIGFEKQIYEYNSKCISALSKIV